MTDLSPETKLRVAVVDDQALMRTGFRMILESADIDVVGEAANGREAITTVAATDPDVVLMDIRMPELDGVEATRQITESGSSARVLILTTFDLEAAAKFYGEVLGWTHELMPTPEGTPPYAFLRQGEAVIAGLGQMADEMKAQGIPPLWNSYVATTDCEATEAQVEELGATILRVVREEEGEPCKK